MPIQATCPSCKKTIRVGDQHAGKKARCPHCQGVVEIPAAGGGSAVGGGAATWHVQTPEDRFGPITKAELDKWAAERRIDQDCQVWCEGWPEWKFAPELYPALTTQAAAPTSAPAFGGANFGGPPALPGAGFPAITPAAPSFGGPYASPQTSSYGGGGGDDGSGAKRVLNQAKPWIMVAAIAGFVLGALLLLGAIDSFRILGRISDFDPPTSVWAMLFLTAIGNLSLSTSFIGGGIFLLVFTARVGFSMRASVRPASLWGPLRSYFAFVAVTVAVAALCLGIARLIAYSVGGDSSGLFF